MNPQAIKISFLIDRMRFFIRYPNYVADPLNCRIGVSVGKHHLSPAFAHSPQLEIGIKQSSSEVLMVLTSRARVDRVGNQN